MDKQYSVKFFTTFIENLQNICQEHLTFDQVVEVSGYLSVEIDNAQKERYVLSELLQSCGNSISESYCTKAFKTHPLTLRGGKKPNTSKRHAEDEKENGADDVVKSSKSSSASPDGVASFEASESKQRKLSSKSEKAGQRKLELFVNRDGFQRKKNIAGTSVGKKKPGIGCIGSRSSSFLASSARLCSSEKEVRKSGEIDTLHDFVSSIVDSLSSNSKKQHSTEELLSGHPQTSMRSSRSSKRSSRSSSSTSSSELDLPLLLPSTADSFQCSKKSSMQSLLVSSSKSSPRQGQQAVATSLNQYPERSSSGDTREDNEDMNLSSMRHLVSKSNESPTRLKHRKTGTEGDIPHGQAYIEVVDEIKEELDLEACLENAADAAGDGDGDADRAKFDDVNESAVSQTGEGSDVGCTVSSSLMLEAGSIASSVDEAELANYAISEDSEPGDMENLDSPIIINLDDDESSDGEERETTAGDDSDPFSSIELRKLETFKDYVKFAVKRVQIFLKKKNVRDPVYRIPPKKLDPLLAEFYVTVRNMRGEDFGVSTLKSIQSYLEQYLRENGYPVSITRDEEFANCRAMLATKVQHLRQARHEIPNHARVAMPITRRDVEKLFKTHLLGNHSAESVTNSMWFMNTVLFKLSKTEAHLSLRWGDVVVKVDEYLNEYLELIHTNAFRGDSTDLKIYPNNANPDQCFLKMYKRFQILRPPEMLTKKSPFYLSVDRQLDVVRSERMKLPELSVILRRMLLQTGIQPEKQIINFDIL